MYKINLVFLLLFGFQVAIYGQITQGFLDSLSFTSGYPNGITVYPVVVNDIRMSEKLFLDINNAHLAGVKNSGILNPVTQISKKHVKKNELDVSLADVIKHSGQPCISILKFQIMDMYSNYDFIEDFTPLTFINILATHYVYDISTGKKIHSKLIHVRLDLTKFANRYLQNDEICRVIGNEIKSGLQSRFSIYSNVVAMEKDDKNKAKWIVVDGSFSDKSEKKDLYINKVVKTFKKDDQLYYQIETIGKANFKQKYNPTTMMYTISQGAKELGQYNTKNLPVFLSTHSF